MAFFDKFYANRSDPNLLKDIIGEGIFWDIAKLAQDDTSATLDKTTPAATTLTFSGAIPGVSDDDLIGGIAVVKNNNGVGRMFTIDDNTTTVITIDLTSALCESDETANFTTATAYVVKLWSPFRFLGYTENAELNDVPEYKDYITGIPEKKRAKKLVRRFPVVNMDIRTTGISLDEALLGAVDTNPSATNQSHLRVGSGSEGLEKYMFHAYDQFDEGAREIEFVLFNTLFIPNGPKQIETDADSWVIQPATIDILSEPRMGDEEDYYEIRRDK